MSVIRKDLGIATAYGYAVSKGYTGTEEEFAELMASYATVAEEAQEAAEQATQAVQTTQAAVNTATTKAGEAATSASGAATSASQAGQSATAAAGSASTASAKATEAGTSATNAAASETVATQAAQTATTKAGEASASATAASQSATAAAGSASDASDDADRAETAAGSVSAAAEQIATNTADIADLKDDLSEIEEAIGREVRSKNLIDPSKLTSGRLQSDGSVNAAMTNYATSDYILVEPGSYIFAREKLSDGTAQAMTYSGYGFYDLNKTWVANSRVWDNWDSGVTLPITIAEQCYIRVSGAMAFFVNDNPTIDTALYILQAGTELDGWEAYVEPHMEFPVLTQDDVVQESGANTDKVMSQKAVTDLINASAGGDLDEIAPYVVGKNKYDRATANPQNGYYYGNDGAVSAGNNYAITGKIPVESETTYTFSSTELSTTYMQPVYFSGEDGDALISRDELGVKTFTTPANCTYVGINLFGRSHTEEDYEAAIAIAQLEIGSVPTAYEPYSKKRMIYPSEIVGGSNLDAVAEVTKTQSMINLYNKSLATDGKYFNSVSNLILSSADFAFSGFVPVEPNTQYNVSRDPTTPLVLAGVIYTFDERMNRIGSASLSNYVYSYLLSFTTGNDVRFIAFNMSLADHTTQDFSDTINTIMMCRGTLRPLDYSQYKEEPALLASKLSDAYMANRDCFAGKKWLATGTSITWYDGKTYQAGVQTGEICRGYVGQVSKRKGLLVTNEGISGSTLANVSSNSLINRYQSLDWAGSDIATLEYGINDFGHAVEIGTAEDAAGDTTFAACLKTVIEYALAQNPTLCLVICTEPDVRGSSPNSGGHYLHEYTDVTIAIAEQYRLPVCDWYYRSGINALTRGDSAVNYLTADGTHPNDAGHMRMGAMLNQVFDSLIC